MIASPSAFSSVSLALLGTILLPALAAAQTDESSAPPPAIRQPWQGSRITGSPEPPLPFVLERAFPGLEFDRPVSIHRMPVAGPDSPRRLVVCEQGGKIFSFPADESVETPDLVADLTADPPPRSDRQPEDNRRIDVYSLAFHPEFLSNREVVICYIVSRPGPRRPDGTHIARFRLSDGEPPQLLPESEETILTFDSGGHNGCTVAFGPDGMLYISTGDAASPAPPDPFDHGQNVGDLYSAILRVDIDRRDPGLGYAIPPDNPFVDLADARPEIYAYGFRNPWRMSFDDATGDLWVGDVGWEAWEMIYRVRPGGNYGWPIKEGPGDVRPDATPGPTPILAADVALSHADAASVTGGVVYRGQNHPDLRGHYLFGDWVTRRFWASRFDEERVLETREIAAGNVKPICFETDHEGELLILDYNSAGRSGIHRLRPNPVSEQARVSAQARVSEQASDFPRKLSETGLLAAPGSLQPAPGVVPYRIAAPMARDGATAEYWLAIPGEGQATFHRQPQTMFDWFRTRVTFPPDSVLVKTYFLEPTAAEDRSRRPIETQIAHHIALGDWNHYTYRWDEGAHDATLVPAEGDAARVTVRDDTAPGGRVELTWEFAARSQCRTCHTPWRGETLGLIEPQLRAAPAPVAATAPVAAGGRSDEDAWTRLLRGGWITTDWDADTESELAAAAAASPQLVDPHDPSQPLGRRARSYLHANCAHCHLNGGAASVTIDLSFDLPSDQTGLIDAHPMRGGFGLDDPRLVAAGSPERSALLYRMAKLGGGRMPPIGTNRVDHAGVDLIARWVANLTEDSPEQPSRGDPEQPSRDDPDRRPRPIAEWASGDPLASPSDALRLAIALADGRDSPEARAAIVGRAMNSPPPIAELFEPWADPADRVERLGAGFDPNRVLGQAGDAERGRQGFLAGQGQCNRCHSWDAQGVSQSPPPGLGPTLEQIAAKYREPETLLRHIVDPSLEIADEYRATTVVTDDGRALVGRIVSRDERRVELRDANGERHGIAREAIEFEKPLTQSLMPEQLLDELSARQAADLIAFLLSLRGEAGEK